MEWEVRKYKSFGERGKYVVSFGNARACEVSLLFAKDTALVADKTEILPKFVTEFGRMCDWKMLKVSVDKSKIIMDSRIEGQFRWDVSLNGGKWMMSRNLSVSASV